MWLVKISLSNIHLILLKSLFLKILYTKKDELVITVTSTLLGGIIWMSLTMFVLNIPYEWSKIEGNLLYSMLYLTIGTTVLTLFLYQKASLILGPKKIMAYIYLSPALEL